MSTHTTKQCFGCKEKFRREELIDYTGFNASIAHSYCPKCLKEKESRDKFSIEVCKIFGLKSPGPRIWTERKRLQDTYGYTDDTIIECLKYVYYVEHKKKLSESLCLINPISIDRMMRWKRQEQNKNNQIIAAYQTKIQERIVPIKENNTKIKGNWNPDDWLEGM